MTTISDSAVETGAPSPKALLKAAVCGGKAPETVSAETKFTAPGTARATRRLDPLMMGLAGAGLGLAMLLGAGTAILAASKGDGGSVALAEIAAVLEANRLDASRLDLAFDRLGKAITALKDTSDAARSEARTGSAGLTEKVGTIETTLSTKIAGLAGRIDQAEKEQGTRIATLAAQAEKRTVAVAAAPPATKPEPTQTGSLTETRPKPPSVEKPAVIDTWAVRDVYDGTAMLEDRRRRLVEVAAGESIPGIGRVEAIERRGRAWVVVTRQGIVTPQPW